MTLNLNFAATPAFSEPSLKSQNGLEKRFGSFKSDLNWGPYLWGIIMEIPRILVVPTFSLKFLCDLSRTSASLITKQKWHSKDRGMRVSIWRRCRLVFSCLSVNPAAAEARVCWGISKYPDFR